MEHTLVTRIRKIDSIPPYVAVHKDKEMREEFLEWEGKNNAVRAVLNGDTTFLNEFQMGYHGYLSGEAIGRFSLSGGFGGNIVDIEACLDGYAFRNITERRSLIYSRNSDIGGVMLGFLTGAFFYSLISKRKEEYGRREFLIRNIPGPLLTTLAMSCTGYGSGQILNEFVETNLKLLEQNAVYLDEIKERIFKP